jgi:hypothetical protein
LTTKHKTPKTKHKTPNTHYGLFLETYRRTHLADGSFRRRGLFVGIAVLPGPNRARMGAVAGCVYNCDGVSADWMGFNPLGVKYG